TSIVASTFFFSSFFAATGDFDAAAFLAGAGLSRITRSFFCFDAGTAAFATIGAAGLSAGLTCGTGFFAAEEAAGVAFDAPAAAFGAAGFFAFAAAAVAAEAGFGAPGTGTWIWPICFLRVPAGEVVGVFFGAGAEEPGTGTGMTGTFRPGAAVDAAGLAAVGEVGLARET